MTSGALLLLRAWANSAHSSLHKACVDTLTWELYSQSSCCHCSKQQRLSSTRRKNSTNELTKETRHKKPRDLRKHLLGSGEETKWTQHVYHRAKVTLLWRFITGKNWPEWSMNGNACAKRRKKNSITRVNEAASASTQGPTDSDDMLMKMLFMPRPEGLRSDKPTALTISQQKIPLEESDNITVPCLCHSSSRWHLRDTPNVKMQTKHSRF